MLEIIIAVFSSIMGVLSAVKYGKKAYDGYMKRKFM